MTRQQQVGAGVGALLGLVLAVLLYGRFGDGGISVAVRSFEVQERSVRVDFSVTKDKDESVVCTVRARDRDGEEIGIALVPVGPSDEGSTLVSYDLQTTARPVTGEVTECSRAPAAPASAPVGTGAP